MYKFGLVSLKPRFYGGEYIKREDMEKPCMLDKRILPVGNVEKGEVFEQRITSAKEFDFSCSII